MMDDALLLAAIERHEANAETYGNLQEERTDALDYYFGKPLGNEVPGRSQVVARTVWDTVEWIKPQLSDVFCSGEEIVSFAPKSPDDVKAAEQESDYVNHIVTQRNNWFEVWYSWAHDALIQKTGYVKAYWDDEADITTERYERLTGDEYALLMQDPNVEVVEHTEETVVSDPNPVTAQQMLAAGQLPQPIVEVLHSVKLERKKPRNTVRIENVAPEYIRVSQDARGLSLQDDRLPFVQHAEPRTISDLRAQGLDVPDDINDGGDSMSDWEAELRDDYTPFRDREGEETDPSMRRVLVRETWIRLDFNGDGRAELRHIIVVGKTVLLNEETDHVPLVALCPAPLSHRHYGLSMADAVMDLQRIQTALMRGALDNQYLANNGRYAVDENNVNLDDMLDSRPGGIVRVTGQPGAAILPLTHSTTGQVALPMLEYVDRIGQKRTGVNEQTQGLDPNALNKTATGAQMLMSAAQQRIKFIARIFAETGVKALFQLVHQLTLQHSRQAELVRLRGEWVPVDPRTWVKRNDLQISMNLGLGDRAQQLAFLGSVRQMQLEGLQIGVCTPVNVFNTQARMMRAAGYKDVSEFFQDPRQAPPQPPQPNPALLVEQMRLQADAQKFQAEQQFKQQAEAANLQADQLRKQAELEVQSANDMRDAERAREQAAMEAQLEQIRIEAERANALLAAETARYQAELQAQTQILLKQMENPAAEGQQPNNEALAAAMQGFTAALEQMRAPKTIIRGPDGRAQGIA